MTMTGILLAMLFWLGLAELVAAIGREAKKFDEKTCWPIDPKGPQAGDEGASARIKKE